MSRLVIDARNGRIVRFVPAYHFGLGYGGGPDVAYGPPGRFLPVLLLDEGSPEGEGVGEALARCGKAGRLDAGPSTEVRCTLQ